LNTQQRRSFFGRRDKTRGKNQPVEEQQQEGKEEDLFTFILNSLADLADDVFEGTSILCSGCGEHDGQDQKSTTASTRTKKR